MSNVTKPIMLNETGEQIVQKLSEMTESNKSYEMLLNTKADKVDVSAPFNFKGDTTYASLPTSGNKLNDTYYCSDKKCRYTWNGEGWYQSSMNEVDYTDELAKMESDLEAGISQLSSEIVELGKYGINLIPSVNYSLRIGGGDTIVSTSGTALASTGFVEVEPNESYVFHGDSTSLLGAYFGEDAVCEIGQEILSKVSFEQIDTTTGRFTTPNGAKFVMLNLNKTNDTVPIRTYQLEKGYYKSVIGSNPKNIQDTIRVTSDNTNNSDNIVMGYEKNAVAEDLHGCVIVGGGSPQFSNKIGAYTNNVWDGEASVSEKKENDTMKNGTNAHLSVIGGGYDNIANGLASMLKGYHCVIEETVTHGTISGGARHIIETSDYGTIGGGLLNKIKSAFGTIGGGKQNLVDAESEGGTIGGGFNNRAKAYATVGGGQNNTASGSLAVICGGNSNTAQGIISAVLCGQNNEALAKNAIAYGRECKSVAENAIAHGRDALATSFGEKAWSNGKIANQGDRQHSEYLLQAITTDETLTYLTTDGTNRINLEVGETWDYECSIMCVGANVRKKWKVIGMCYRDESGVHEVGNYSITSFGNDNVELTIGFGTSSLLFSCVGNNEELQWFGNLSVNKIKM